MLSMRKKNLFQCSILIFFCIIGFVISINCEVAQVQSPCDNTPYIPEETENNEFKFLVENIYDLLQQNHSTDEIIEILSDDQDGPYDIQKLVIHVNELLHGQNSKGSVINIIVDNKDSKEYYAHKNFLTDIKVCYFVLKIVAIIVAAILIYFLWTRHFKLPLSGKDGIIPGLSKPRSDNVTDNGKSACGANFSQHQDASGHSAETDSCEQSSKLNLDFIKSSTIKHCFDSKTYKAMIQQLGVAKGKGLIASDEVFDAIGASKGREDNNSIFFKMRLTEQIELAKCKGWIKPK